ncbi:MAG TPA: hypothetical protein PK771_13710, partial [Spirochaetota bacterium]|nr:hypothetical protein [Spirochaetota bacterium]
MRFIFIIFIIFFTLNFNLHSEENFTEFENYSSFKDNFFPNDEGDENELKLINYIEKFMNFYKISYSKKKIEGDLYTTNSYNIEIILNSQSTTEEEIIVICPLNSAIYQQEFQDNSLTIKIMLNLIKLSKGFNFNKKVIFLFSGANRRENDYEFWGLRNYINNKINFNKSIVLFLDILSNKEKIKFSGSINRKPLPLTFLKDFLKLKNQKYFYFENKELIMSKLGVVEIKDYTSFMLDKNISVIGFSNREKTYYNEYIFDLEYEKDLTDYFFKWIIELEKKRYPLEIDYNYQFYNFKYFYLLIPEYIEVVIFLSVIFIIFLLRNILPHFQRLKINLMLKILPFFLILFILFYILSFIPYIIFLPISFITKTTNPFLNIPILYFFCIFFVPQMILFLLYELLEKMPFPKHNYLYIYGAMIFSYLNLFLFVLVDISLAYIYLWVAVMITLSNFTG